LNGAHARAAGRRLVTESRTDVPGKRRAFWAVVLAGVGLDLVTKAAAFVHLPSGGEARTLIPGFLDLMRSTNTGGAFGLLRDSGILLGLLSVAAVGAIVWFAFTAAAGTAGRWGLSLVLAGAVGNLWDRVLHSHVRDFISVYVRVGGRDWRWPTFNVADIWICVGVGLLLLASFAGSDGSGRRPSKAAGGSD
jgi:lipoprotein signal peptidase